MMIGPEAVFKLSEMDESQVNLTAFGVVAIEVRPAYLAT